MQSFSNRFITTEEVRNLTAGSFEHLIVRVEQAVREQGPQLFGVKIESRVLGTFTGYAIVLLEDGRFFRLRYLETRAGVQIVSQESIKGPTLRPDNLDGYLRGESTRAADSFIQGDVQGALTRLKGLVRFVEPKTTLDEEKIVDTMIVFHRAERSWKNILTEKSAIIRQMVLDETQSIQEDRLRIKFRPLYDGSVRGTALETYRDLVRENLAKIGERSTSLATQVSDALNSSKSRHPSPAPVVRALFDFGNDLVEDLGHIQRATGETSRLISRVDCLGKLHDTFAEDFPERELASRFVIQMSKRLCESANS